MEQTIVGSLRHVTALIEKDQLGEASAYLQRIACEQPEWIDDRFQAELGMIMKQIEYKLCVKGHSQIPDDIGIYIVAGQIMAAIHTR